MKNVLIVLTASAVLLTGCATGGSVGDMAIGDDSTAVKAGRNRAEAQLSRSELEQHRRQRTNVSEELDLEQKKRSNKQQQVGGAMGTVILPFLMDRISRIKCSSMAAYHRWLDEAFHDYRTTTNGWHNPEYHLSC